MSSLKNKIIIVFSNKAEWLGREPIQISTFLNRSHLYEYSDKTLMRDLLWSLLSEIGLYNDPCFKNDEEIRGRFYVTIDGLRMLINLDYPIQKFIDNNATDGTLFLEFVPTLPGGWGAKINETIKLQMPSSEHGHEKIPHVHIYKNGYQGTRENVIRINLITMSIMDNAELKARRLFGRKELDEIFDYLESNRERLIKQYDCMLKGGVPEEVCLCDTGDGHCMVLTKFR